MGPASLQKHRVPGTRRGRALLLVICSSGIVATACAVASWAVAIDTQALLWTTRHAVPLLTEAMRIVTIFGDGRQVRDLLFIDDLIDAYERVLASPNQVAGQVYNLGGGPERTVSVWFEFGALLESMTGLRLEARFEPWRAGDQRVAVLDTRKVEAELGWAARTSVEEGVRQLIDWLAARPGDPPA